MAKKVENTNEFFEDLKAGLLTAIEYAEGKRANLRTTTFPSPPKELLRASLNVSQSVFARNLNISPRTVQSWEQGLGKPSGASLKLLSIAKKNPQVLLGG